MTRPLAAWTLLCLLFVWGCGGSSPPPSTAKNTGPAAAPPPPPSAAPPPPVAAPALPSTPAPMPEAAPGGSFSIPTPNIPAPAPTDTEPDPAPFAVPAVEGPLAPHARALAMVDKNDCAIVKVDMQRVHASPLLAQSPLMLPKAWAEPVRAMIAQGTAMPHDLETMWIALAVPPPRGDEPSTMPQSRIVCQRWRTRAAMEAYLAFRYGWMGKETPGIEFDGKVYYQSPKGDSFYLPVDRDLFVASWGSAIPAMLESKGKLAETPLIDRLEAAAVDAPIVASVRIGPLRPFFEAVLSSDKAWAAGEVPSGITRVIPKGAAGEPMPDGAEKEPERVSISLAPFVALTIADGLETASIALDDSGPNLVEIRAYATNLDKAAALNDILKESLATFNRSLPVAAELAAKQDGGQQVAEVYRYTATVTGSLQIETRTNQLVITLPQPAGIDQLPRLLMAAAAARENARRAIESPRTLHRAVLWTANAQAGRFPTNLTKGGQKLLSWRVLILPHMGYGSLYDKFDRTKPWDSEENMKLLAHMPDVFKTPSAPEPNTTTWKLLVSQPGGVVLVDAGKDQAVPWTQPEEFVIDPEYPLSAMGQEPPGGYTIVRGNGGIERHSSQAFKDLFSKLPKTAFVPPPTGTGAPPVAGVDPPPAAAPKFEVREWRDASGSYSVKGRLVKVVGNQITVEREDNGMQIAIPRDKLSEDDQKYLEEALRKLR